MCCEGKGLEDGGHITCSGASQFKSLQFRLQWLNVVTVVVFYLKRMAVGYCRYFQTRIENFLPLLVNSDICVKSGLIS